MSPAPPPRCSLLRAILRGLVAGAVLAFLGQVLYVQAGPNFHTVVPGHVYRSGQFSEGRLRWYVRRYGIRTVVNLRGCDVHSAWYREEARATSRLEVSQEDLGFSANRLPSAVALRELIAVLDRSEPPLLLHCHKGADRTGLASVLAVLLHTDAPFLEARRQLGLRTGHVAFGRTANIDRFLDLYQRWLGEAGVEHTPAILRAWANRHYCPGPGRAELVGLSQPARGRAGQPFAARVRCTNRAIEPWRMHPDVTAGIHLRYHLNRLDGQRVTDGRAGLFHATVRPGESIVLELALPSLEVGRYLLSIDLVDERNGSFLQMGNEPLYLPVEVS